MDNLSSRIAKVTPSLTLAVTNQAKALQAQGEEIYGLAGGEPEMDTPDHIKEACYRALKEGKTKYTPAAGIPEIPAASWEATFTTLAASTTTTTTTSTPRGGRCEGPPIADPAPEPIGLTLIWPLGRRSVLGWVLQL